MTCHPHWVYAPLLLGLLKATPEPAAYSCPDDDSRNNSSDENKPEWSYPREPRLLLLGTVLSMLVLGGLRVFRGV